MLIVRKERGSCDNSSFEGGGDLMSIVCSKGEEVSCQFFVKGRGSLKLIFFAKGERISRHFFSTGEISCQFFV